MLKFKKGGLRNFIGDNAAEVAAPEAQLEPTPAEAPQPAVEAVKPQESWQMLLAKALTAMPSDTLTKVVGCIPRDVLIEVIKAREDDPIVKLALVLLNAQR